MLRTCIVAAACACAALCAWHAGAAPAPDPARTAIERSLPYLEREGSAWLEGRVPIQKDRACVSCHHGAFAVWSHHEASRTGISVPAKSVAELERRAVALATGPGEGQAVVVGQLLLAGTGAASPAESPAGPAALLPLLAHKQETDGHWRAGGQFPTQKRPAAESDAVATMWSILALASNAAPVEESGPARDRALSWLRQADPGETTEWLLLHMLVEGERGDPRAAEADARRLLERQNEDGGWSFAPGQPSDALTTGQVLYALGRARRSSGSSAVERAVAWLVGQQRPDGSWQVPSRLTSTAPSAGKDQVYTYWGTAWAAIGLSRTLR